MRPAEAPRIAAKLPEAVTERLRLSRVVATDVELLAPVFAEQAVWEFPFGRGMDRDWTAGFVSRAVDHWRRFGFGLWIVRTLRNEEVIGYLGLSMPDFLSELIPAERMPAVEVGWRLHPDHWGNGYATEGAGAALREAFETLELTELWCVTQKTNPRSAHVAKRIGMQYERTATLRATDARGAVDVDVYWLTHVQWVTASHHAGTSMKAVDHPSAPG